MCLRKVEVMLSVGGYADRKYVEASVKCGEAYISGFSQVSIARCDVCNGINESNEQYLFINGNGWSDLMSEQEWLAGIYSMHYSVDACQLYLQDYATHRLLYEWHFHNQGWVNYWDVELNGELLKFSANIYLDKNGFFWHEDETGEVFGPFACQDECKKALDIYVYYLEYGHYGMDVDCPVCSDIQDFDNEDRTCLCCGRGVSGCDNRNEITDRNVDIPMDIENAIDGYEYDRQGAVPFTDGIKDTDVLYEKYDKRDIVASNGAITMFKCTALGMAEEWLSGKQGYDSVEVIEQLVFELKAYKELAEKYKKMYDDEVIASLPF